ncbi:putative primosomal protein N' [Nocardia cerradoensis]|uniref:Probable replication restart protein PriA n=1 Tax=Nocardia cerradoensis TaxID=85688 RepID=A0A231H4C8_9NOCA|nr:primosomal protein N' [Nocardia cerradoensis]OXR43566.1 putative primosomal protein N' [Nocardia cerradoensis]
MPSTDEAADPEKARDTPIDKPIARVLPLLEPAHLDRDFDYSVPREMDELAQPGVRVRVRFSGRLVDGYILERLARTEHSGKIQPLQRVVSGERVLTPEIVRLVSAVAARYAGTRADVLRLAIPPRHARTEAAEPKPVELPEIPEDFPAWSRYVHGESFLSALRRGSGPRAAWQAMPGEQWPRRLAELAATTVASGRSVIVMVPDQRDLDRVVADCAALVGDSVVGLSAGLGPAARYRRWLAVLRGSARVVVGTRSAVFAPARELGLIVVWDDGDDTYAEPRAPYPHAREVAMLRAHETGAACVIAGFARTAEAQAIVESGWAHDLIADRKTLRANTPRIHAPGDSDIALERDPMARAIRIPGTAFAAARRALAAGDPVLVQVPRRGYVPALACAKCRTPARCRHCNGPLSLPESGAWGRREARQADRSGGAPPSRGGAARPAGEVTATGRVAVGDRQAGHAGPRHPDPSHPDTAPAERRSSAVPLGSKGSGDLAQSPSCRWCGKVEPAFRCGTCGSRVLRAVVIGAQRTAEELGRAFPGVPIRGSGGAAVLDAVPDGPQVVVATIGAEPTVPGGYAVALLLDGWALLGRADLRAAEDALRRWMSAAALVRPTGEVLVMAEPALPTVQALVRWDPIGHARHELAARSEVRFPPAVRLAAVDGTTATIGELLGETALPDDVEVLGPVPLPPGARTPFSGDVAPAEVERMILRVDRRAGSALSRALAAALAVRSSHRSDGPLRVQIDPVDIG